MNSIVIKTLLLVALIGACTVVGSANIETIPGHIYGIGTNGTVVQDDAASSSGSITPAGHVAPHAGQILEVDISVDSQTNHWAGLYGSIPNSSATRVLITTNPAPDFSQLQPSSGSDVDRVFGFSPSAADSGANTYPQVSNAFTIGNVTIPSTPGAAVYPYVNGEPQTSQFENVVLKLSNKAQIKDDIVFSGKVELGYPSFDGAPADFQVLVPTTGTETYYLYTQVT